MTRREFPRRIKAQIVHRAMNERGQVVCEGCGLVLGKKRYQIDHTLAEELVTDKSKPLTAEDGKLLGQVCCHAPKTANDIRRIRKADRQRHNDRGIKKRTGSSFPGGRDSNLKRKVSGEVVPRQGAPHRGCKTWGGRPS